MITTSDAINIVHLHSLKLGLPVYQKPNIPLGEVMEERITVNGNSQNTETYWNKAYINVNIEVPDREGEGDTRRLQEWERMAYGHYRKVVGDYDGTLYRFQWDEIGREEHQQLRCHYVNVRILFEVLNVN